MSSQGSKTSEFKLTWIGVIVACVIAVVPVLLDALPRDSVYAVILGAILSIATTVSVYTNGRSKVKAQELAAKAIEKAGVAAIDPS